SGSQCGALCVINHLGIDVFVTSKHSQARAHRRTGKGLPDSAVNPDSNFICSQLRHDYLPPAFPAFFFRSSPTYRIPLFLYGSGFFKDRIFAATCPTCCRSTPATTSFV